MQEEEQKKIKKVCNSKFTRNSPCPCGSGYKYKKCCQPLHKGKLPKSALALMRSRYSAFALNIPKYIIHTTHKNNQDFTENREKWTEDIENFSNNCQFKNLEILDASSNENVAFVSFKATILCNNKDCSFSEKSKFLKENEKWLYLSGVFL